MPRLLRNLLIALREFVVTAGPVAAVAVGLVVFAFWAMKPMPPRSFTLATGPEQSAFDAFGDAYKRAVERRRGRITTTLVRTEGPRENLSALQRPDGPDFGFVRGGTITVREAEESELVSVGSLFLEPVWIFYRSAAFAGNGDSDGEPARVADFVGRRVTIGTEGSGVPDLFTRLLEANRVDPASMKVDKLADTPAVVELIEGRSDAAVLVSAPESPLVQMLLQTPGIGLVDFAQADAYERRFGFLTRVTLPRGVVDLGKDVPARDYRLIATTSTLVARRSTHPALVQLMVQTAAEVHGGQGWFRRAGEFPSPDYTDVPVADEARRFYRDGVPFLQRYLPFWVANLIERMWLVLAAIVAVLIPLSRLVPPIYQFRIRSRIFRWYGQLRDLEDRIGHDPADDLRDALDRLDARVGRIQVPLSYADELYALRSHIRLVRARAGADAALRAGSAGPRQAE